MLSGSCKQNSESCTTTVSLHDRKLLRRQASVKLCLGQTCCSALIPPRQLGSIAGTSGGNSGPSCGILILSHLLQAIGTPQKVSEVKLLEDNTGRKVVEHSLQCPARYETAP